MKKIFQSVGPALIVAAVVLGPGSILTSSKVGATLGVMGFPIVAGAAVLMIAMVALSARLGAFYEKSLCEELSDRLGRPVSVLIGTILFILVALFQSSNNIALIAGLEPMLGDSPLTFEVRAGILVGCNLLVIAILYLMRDLYRFIETGMKILIGLMIVAFLINFVVVMVKPRSFVPSESTTDLDWLALMGMIGTTFSVGGAFYQAYLVKEKGWGIKDVRKGTVDSIVSISILGGVTAIILLSSWRVFYGQPGGVQFSNVGDVARQLEPSFGKSATVIFCTGILAGGLSSFLVNALIGGTVMADSIGKGARLSDRWPVHMTTLALLVGMAVGIASLFNDKSTVHLITVAQACTVIGIPALAAALIFLAVQPEILKAKIVPPLVLLLAIVGFFVSYELAKITSAKVYRKLNPVVGIDSAKTGVPNLLANSKNESSE